MSADQDLDMMRKPMAWPRWPFLPLKCGVNREASFGFLVAASRGSNVTEPAARVFIGSIYGLNPDTPLSTLQSRGYDSLEDLRADGWVVD